MSRSLLPLLMLTTLLASAAAPTLAADEAMTPVPVDLDERPLDELWEMACLWQVGSNRDVVPAAREALIRRGPAVLDWLIPDKLDTDDSLVTRALTDVARGLGAEAATPRLLPQLQHGTAAVRRNPCTESSPESRTTTSPWTSSAPIACVSITSRRKIVASRSNSPSKNDSVTLKWK